MRWHGSASGGKILVMFLIVATSMFPPVIILVVPLLKLFTGGFEWWPWNWINTYQAMILPSISFALPPLAVWNLNAYFRQLPVELEQAAMVDGTTRFGAFARVILPLATPGMFTTAIITFIAAWNEFLIALTMVNRPEMQTANVAISKFTGISQFDTPPYGTKMAAGVIVTVPLIIMVLAFQRRIIGGLAAGERQVALVVGDRVQDHGPDWGRLVQDRPSGAEEPCPPPRISSVRLRRSRATQRGGCEGRMPVTASEEPTPDPGDAGGRPRGRPARHRDRHRCEPQAQRHR